MRRQPRAGLVVRGAGGLLFTGALLFLTGCWIDEKTTPEAPQAIPNNPVPVSPAAPATAERDKALHGLHEQCVKSFAEAPGFGASRLGPLHSPGNYPRTIPLPAGSCLSAAPAPAGADPATPGQETWDVVSVEMIGLVMHPEPTVYPNPKPGEARLPRRGTPGRKLDDFEKEALPNLEKGAAVEIREGAREIRMIGAINRMEKCMNCHKDAKSDTLGAFSYTLRPAAKK